MKQIRFRDFKKLEEKTIEISSKANISKTKKNL